jgi:TonB-dependent Receptor Plug Domain
LRADFAALSTRVARLPRYERAIADLVEDVMIHGSLRHFSPLALLTAASAAACGIKPAPGVQSASPTTIVTAEQIAETGASDAWDAIRLTVRGYYFREDRGQPVRMLSKRGQGSLVSQEEPFIIVNNVRINDVAYLRDIPASQIVSIRVYTQNDAATYFGTNSVGGVIVLETMLGQSR